MDHKNTIYAKTPWATLKKSVATVLTTSVLGKLIQFVYSGKIPFRGTRIEVPQDCDPYIAASLFWGFYESAERRYIDKFLGTEYDVIELGSSLGGISCQIASKLHGRRRLVCVEANPNLIPYLKRNLQLNSPEQQVSIVNAAIAQVSAYSVLFSASLNTLNSSLDGRPGSAVMQVDAITLYALLQREQITDYALVCDIEGAELFILQDNPESLARCRLLIIETHEVSDEKRTYSADDIIELVQKVTPLELSSRYGNVCVFQPATV